MSFSARLAELAETAFTVTVSAFATAITAVSVVQIIFVFISVGFILLTFYARPIRTKKQAVKMLIYLLAGLSICCMTVWIYLKTQAS